MVLSNLKGLVRVFIAEKDPFVLTRRTSWLMITTTAKERLKNVLRKGAPQTFIEPVALPTVSSISLVKYFVCTLTYPDVGRLGM